jgi:hypothetical protein
MRWQRSSAFEKRPMRFYQQEKRHVHAPSPGELLRAIVFVRSGEQNHNESLTADARHIQAERESLKEINVENEPPSFLKWIWDGR